MEISIRRFRPDDARRLREITSETFGEVSIDGGIERDFGLIAGRDWKWRKARHIDADMERDADGIFVAERAGRVVGYVTTWTDQDGSTGFIPNLAVSADCQGRGVGRKLLGAAIDHFRDRGVAFARIETLEQNEVGRHLYPSVGFREVARQIHYGMSLEKGDDAAT